MPHEPRSARTLRQPRPRRDSMHVGIRWRRALVLVVVSLCIPALAAQRGGLKKIPGARDLGKTSSSKMVTVSFWLRMHQPDAVAQKAQAVHDPSSGQYQQWSAAAFSAANSPT